MKLNPNLHRRHRFQVVRPVLALSLMAIVAGCGRDDVKVYRVAKDTPEALSSPHGARGQGQLPAGHPDVAPAMPRLKWTLPAGWEERPASQMRAATFAVPGSDGKSADISVIPLPTTGREVELVNMWRSQMKLAPVGEAETAKLAENVTVAGEQGKLFEMTSETPVIEDKFKGRMLIAILNRGDTSWFFKMTGEESLVREQKAAFVSFLKSVEFLQRGVADATALPPSHTPVGSATVAATSAGTAAEGGGKPNWKVPAGWQEVPGGQFLVAKFNISGEGNAQAAVNVSMSSGDGGGLLANVNRWRQQLGLSPTSEAELTQSSTSVEIAGAKATLVDMSGTDARTGQRARVVGAIVPQAGQTWFYKLMGETKLVASQKEAFTQFVQNVRY